MFDSPTPAPALVALKYRPSSSFNLEYGTAFAALLRLHQHAASLDATPSTAALAHQSRELEAWLRFTAIRETLTP